ncbi:MAG TPA: hypothetical protein PK393_10130, partial [Synergistaceae bacterium]|nr:hypothetical protein [Synergistaceae bacterium]
MPELVFQKNHGFRAIGILCQFGKGRPDHGVKELADEVLSEFDVEAPPNVVLILRMLWVSVGHRPRPLGLDSHEDSTTGHPGGAPEDILGRPEPGGVFEGVLQARRAVAVVWACCGGNRLDVWPQSPVGAKNMLAPTYF